MPASTHPVEDPASPAPPATADAGRQTRWTLVDRDGHVLTDVGREEIEERLKRHAFFWLDLHAPGPDDVAVLRDVFGFHPLAVEDSLDFGQRPKLDTYDDFALLVAYGASPDADGLVEVHCFSAERFLVTVRHDDCPAFAAVQRRYMRLQESSFDETMLLYHVVDGLVDSFFPALSEFDERIDRLEDEIFTHPREGQLQEIFAMKQHLVGLRRVVSPQRDMFAQLVTDASVVPGMTTESARYFRDVYDHLIRLSEMIDSYRELMTGAMEVYLSTVANRRDEVMKQLTVIATVFLPITFVTGFFGQNFGFMVDHVSGPVQFLSGAALQIAIVAFILVYFRRKHWIGGESSER